MKLDHRLDEKTVAGLKLPAGKNEEIFWDPELENYGCRLRASGTTVRRSYIVQYRRAGATRRLRLGSPDRLGEKQARAAARKALAAVALGQDPQAEKVARRNQDQFTFRAVADDYLNAKQPTVRPRTFVEMQRYLCGPYFKGAAFRPSRPDYAQGCCRATAGDWSGVRRRHRTTCPQSYLQLFRLGHRPRAIAVQPGDRRRSAKAAATT